MPCILAISETSLRFLTSPFAIHRQPHPSSTDEYQALLCIWSTTQQACRSSRHEAEDPFRICYRWCSEEKEMLRFPHHILPHGREEQVCIVSTLSIVVPNSCSDFTRWGLRRNSPEKVDRSNRTRAQQISQSCQ